MVPGGGVSLSVPGPAATLSIAAIKFRGERPMWSDDGKSLIFYWVDQNDNATIWSIDRCGGEPRVVAGPLALNKGGWFGVCGYLDWNYQIAISRAMR